MDRASSPATPAAQRLWQPRRLPHLPPLPAGWPLGALLVGYPLWWALGFGVLIFPILALPMAVELLRRRPIRTPPGFGLWVLFLLWYLASAAMLWNDPPQTFGEPGLNRLVSFAFRFSQYAAVTIMLLYAGNLSERELPRLRLVRWLGVFFLVTVAGGVLGVLAPQFEFTSPMEILLPSQLSDNGFVQGLVHPHSAQVMEVLGYSSPRPSAPFNYTNTWGNVLSVTLVWFVVGWWTHGGRARRLLTPLILAGAVVIVVISLNRGTWLALLLAAAYIIVRLIAWGRSWALGTASAVLAVGTVVFIMSPLHTLVEERLANPHSNSRRVFTTVRTLEASAHSPILGFGTTRTARGSAQSIAVGESPSCPRCGNPTLGSNGQLWLVLISQGYVGVLLYVGFFTYSVLRYWRDRTPVGVAGTLVLLLSLYYMFVYNALVTPLAIYLLALALLWRNDVERKHHDRTSVMRNVLARSRSGTSVGAR